MSEDSALDLRGVLCPINWVRAKLALEELPEGESLVVILDDGEPIRNVPRSVKEDGHRVTGVEKEGNDAYRITIRRGPD